MKRSLPFIAAAFVLAACSDSSTEPLATPNTASALKASAAVASSVTEHDYAGEISDITSRVLPSFDDAAAAGQIGALLTKLSDDLAKNDRTAAAADIALLRQALKPGIASPADLGNVELLLDMIERSL